MTFRRLTAILTASALTLSACTNAADEARTPAPSSGPASSAVAAPSPSSTSATPSPSPSATPSSTVDAALLKEAQRVEKEVLEMEFSLIKTGGLPEQLESPPSMKKVLMGEALKKTREQLNIVWVAQMKYRSGEQRRVPLAVADVAPQQASVIALEACRDLSGVRFSLPQEKELQAGGVYIQTSWFSRDKDGHLKMSDWVERKAPSC